VKRPKHDGTYIAPENCHSPKKNWTLLKVLFDHKEGKPSLAIGMWDKIPRLAIRWNGTKGRPIGNPQSRGLPTWFMLPEDMGDMANAAIKSLSQDDKDFVRKLLFDR
jgi:hypothetical protein